MAVDTQTKRRSALAATLAFLVVAPLADGTVANVDREHIVGIYAGISPAAPGVSTSAIHIFSTTTVEPNHASDSGNNVLIAGDVEVQGVGWYNGNVNINNLTLGGSPSIISSANALQLKPSGDTDDYIQLTTVDDVPTIGTVGNCDLKITSSSGEIDFDDENLLFDTWKSADGSKNIAWSSTAAGSLVLDGGGDYVNITDAKADVNTATGTMAIWGKMDSSILTDGNAYVAYTVSDGATNANVISVRKTNANKLNVRYRVGGVNFLVDTANVTGFDSWKLYILTWDATFVYLYVDNTLIGSTNRSASSDINGANFTDFSIGTVFTNATEWLGELSDALLFDVVFDQTKVNALFALGRNPTSISAAAGGANLQSWWPFTADAKDAEGTRDGTFVGNAYVNSTAVVGLNTNDPLLINGALTVVGPANVTGNLTCQGAGSIAGDLNLDSGINFNSSSGATIASTVSDQDIDIKVNDGGSTTTVLTFVANIGQVQFPTTATNPPAFASGLRIGSPSATSRQIANAPNGSISLNVYIGDEVIDTSPSGRAIKKNITDSTMDVWDLLNKLRIVDFEYIEPSKGTQRQIGLIAQEVYEIPELRQFTRWPDNDDPNESVKPIAEQKGWGGRWNMMVPMLIKAIVELKAKVEILEKVKVA